MAHAILSQLVNPKLLEDRNFQYQRAHLKELGSEDSCVLTPGDQKKRVYLYFKDPTSSKWYFGNDNPHPTKRLLGVMALGTLVLYLATIAVRMTQTVIILAGVFFRSYKATFSDRKKENFSETFFKAVEIQFSQQKEELLFIGKSLVLDTQCSLAMGVSGIAANFYNNEDKIRKMEVIFSAMEQKWNKGPDFDTQLRDELSWHADNAPIANWARFFKTTDLEGMTFQQVLGQLNEVRKKSNRTFYLYRYAQPLSKEFIGRLDWIPEIFESYKDYLNFHKQKLDSIRSSRPL